MRTRILQGMYACALAIAAHLTFSTPASAAEQPVWCELCTSVQCIEENDPQMLGFCDDLCDGDFIEFQCIGGAPCTGQGGGSYPNRLRCLRDIP